MSRAKKLRPHLLKITTLRHLFSNILDNMSQERPQWLIYAIASGGCAALNGAFAKLTTTQLTTTWAAALSLVLGFEETSTTVEYAIRAVRN
jgi:hypothetical protein